MMRRIAWAAILILIVPQVTLATITFHQLDESTFTISHKVKWIGGRATAMNNVYEKSSSLCIAAGYSHLVLVEQESSMMWGGANATVTVQFFLEDGEGRVSCEANASEEYIVQAKKKLDKRGYKGVPPARTLDKSESSENHCTIEQITAMTKAGMTDNQIKAACFAQN